MTGKNEEGVYGRRVNGDKERAGVAGGLATG